jgi:hypothetical protein
LEGLVKCRRSHRHPYSLKEEMQQPAPTLAPLLQIPDWNSGTYIASPAAALHVFPQRSAQGFPLSSTWEYWEYCERRRMTILELTWWRLLDPILGSPKP